MAVGVVYPRGFRAAGVTAGIKASGRPDVAIVAADRPVPAAAVFTRSATCAPPVLLSRAAIRNGSARAVVVQSGNANAATGSQGLRDAERMAACAADALDAGPDDVLVASTGVIGVPLPMESMMPEVPAMAARAVHGSVEPFARAIMTTDTYPKWSSRTVEHGGHACTVVGCAKGAGMIHPNMATMIAVIMTDAPLAPAELDGHLRAAVERSFHRISIDGDTSTNDSVFALASGAAPAPAGGFPADALRAAFATVARDLALMIVRDGEGYERGIHVRVSGAPSDADALVVAKTIASSLLVRCAVTGGDPNWGRILAAAGRSGVRIDVDDLHLSVGSVALFERGAPADTPLAAREAAFRVPMVTVDLRVGQGPGADEFISCGLTKAYVELNADYTT